MYLSVKYYKIKMNDIVVTQVSGIYGSKRTESKGVAQGRFVYVTINPW